MGTTIRLSLLIFLTIIKISYSKYPELSTGYVLVNTNIKSVIVFESNQSSKPFYQIDYSNSFDIFNSYTRIYKIYQNGKLKKETETFSMYVRTSTYEYLDNGIIIKNQRKGENYLQNDTQYFFLESNGNILSNYTIDGTDYIEIKKYYYSNNILNYSEQTSGVRYKQQLQYDLYGNVIKKTEIRNNKTKSIQDIFEYKLIYSTDGKVSSKEVFENGKKKAKHSYFYNIDGLLEMELISSGKIFYAKYVKM